MKLDEHLQVGQVARLAVLAMCARGVASFEFESDAAIDEIRFVVRRQAGAVELPLEVEFVGTAGFPVGGMSL